MATSTQTSTNLIQPSRKPPPVATRPELELLLCCARTRIDLETAEQIKTLLHKDIDWAFLIQTAAQHGVLPLLYRSLNATFSEVVPQNILKQLRHFFHTNALRNLSLTNELLQLLELFETHKISAIPFKGPVLAASVYGNLSLRQFDDLDILVHKRDVLKAKELLLAHGYELHQPLTAKAEEKLLKSAHHYKIRRENTLLELHWQIAPTYPTFINQFNPLDLDFAPFWHRLEPVSLLDRTVLNFPNEDLLLILCIHGAKDGWRVLKWLCDLNELIGVSPELDWERVIELAHTPHLQRILFLGLFLAHEFLGTRLPENLLPSLQSQSAIRLATQLQKELFSDPQANVELYEWFFKRLIRTLRLIDSFPGRILYAVWFIGSQLIPHIIVPNTEDRAFFPLPNSLSFLYYLVRPIRLVSKHGRLILNHAPDAVRF